jgi:cytoskeletal protein CcmA (bactofilin family)
VWGKKEKSMGFASGSTTLISKSTELVGDIHFNGNLEIEGRVRGNIYAEEGSDARVRIMEKGLVEGEICVPTIVINGSVNGDVHSSKHVELAAKAAVQGNVHYNMIEMVKGAQVNGSLLYSGAGKSGKPVKADAGDSFVAEAEVAGNT